VWTTISRQFGNIRNVTYETTVISSNDDYALTLFLHSLLRSSCPWFALYQNAICIVRDDLWHAIAIHDKEYWWSCQLHRSATNSNGISPSLNWWMMLRNCEFSGARTRERKKIKKREILIGEKKNRLNSLPSVFSAQSRCSMPIAWLLNHRRCTLYFAKSNLSFRFVGELAWKRGVKYLMHFVDVIDSIPVVMHLPFDFKTAPVPYNITKWFFKINFPTFLVARGYDYLVDALAS